ncbi:MAG: hypothetical protein ACOY4U_05725 [Pseudomonadota bacterium]
MKNLIRGMIVACALMAQGCMSLYSKSLPVEREPFDAKGKTVLIEYQLQMTKDDCPNDYVIVIHPCRAGTSEKRARELMKLFREYGFSEYQNYSGMQPDYRVRVVEKHNDVINSGKWVGYMLLSSITFGAFPVIGDFQTSNLKYELLSREQGLVARQHANTNVKVLGGIYPLVLGPFLNNPAQKKSLMLEHDRVIQGWIQGGAFE